MFKKYQDLIKQDIPKFDSTYAEEFNILFNYFDILIEKSKIGNEPVYSLINNLKKLNLSGCFLEKTIYNSLYSAIAPFMLENFPALFYVEGKDAVYVNGCMRTPKKDFVTYNKESLVRVVFANLFLKDKVYDIEILNKVLILSIECGGAVLGMLETNTYINPIVLSKLGCFIMPEVLEGTILAIPFLRNEELYYKWSVKDGLTGVSDEKEFIARYEYNVFKDVDASA